MSVAQAQREIDSHEFVEWRAFNQLEPFGEEVMDTRFARLMALLANINRNPKKSPRAFKIEDFKPDYTELWIERPAMSGNETLDVVKTLAGAFGGKLIKRTDH